MLHLHLSPAEKAVPREVLETAVSGLSTEISGTAAKDFPGDFKARREVPHKPIVWGDGADRGE
jgi:hypothetical protein